MLNYIRSDSCFNATKKETLLLRYNVIRIINNIHNHLNHPTRRPCSYPKYINTHTSPKKSDYSVTNKISLKSFLNNSTVARNAASSVAYDVYAIYS